MAETASTMLALGTKAPGFRLPNVDGKMVSLEDFAGSRTLLVVFMCNHCPYVKHVLPRFVELARDLQSRGTAVVGISANDAGAYPADAPGPMAEVARSAGFSFPYLYDESQDAAKAYRAACTPDFFLFDAAAVWSIAGSWTTAGRGTESP
jgi:peroxiredoxin